VLAICGWTVKPGDTSSRCWPWRSGPASYSPSFAALLDADGNYLWPFLLSVGVSGGLGLATGLVRKRAALRSVAAAIAGDVFVPGLLMLFVIWLFVGAGFCFD
jgi:hypothetical protein